MSNKKAPEPKPRVIAWPRTPPAELASFDPSTKICDMNCGRSAHDPRSDKEMKYQCTDCWTTPKRSGPPQAARLIAAAPELLEALQAVLHWIDDNCETTGFEAVEAMADAALAKAGVELFSNLNAAPAVPTQVYSYWPDGSRQYMELDHWPQRDELPKTAVCFELAVPDPAVSKRQPNAETTALEAMKAENIWLQQRVEWLEGLHRYQEDDSSDAHDVMARPCTPKKP